MSVLASAMITLTYVTSVESETRYYKTQVSTLSPPSKPTSVPPGNGWIETEPTYSDSSATSVLYTCVLTQFTDGTFAYSEVSVSSSYEASKSAYNQAHEANQKLASWCSKTDTTLFDGAKIATGSVITEALDAGCVTTDSWHRPGHSQTTSILSYGYASSRDGFHCFPQIFWHSTYQQH